ncbi:MAG: hypothetical protein C4K58_06055 [Flavobacteriaceae bacterium]|nr:MAG: hypothetical protein C4K58_06055 [Flavobacteriaceae bacterium]
MKTLFRKELSSLFGSSLALGSFFFFHVFLVGLFWWIEGPYNLLSIGLNTPEPIFEILPYLYVFLICILSIPMVQNQLKDGTLVWMFSKPVTDFQIIFSKFLALLFFVVLSFFFVLTQFLGLSFFSDFSLDFGQIFSGFFGLFLVCAVFSSIGIFASSYGEQIAISALLGIFLCLVVFLGAYTLANLFSLNFIHFFGLNLNYLQSVKGILSLEFFFFSLFLMALFLALGVYNIEIKRR